MTNLKRSAAETVKLFTVSLQLVVPTALCTFLVTVLDFSTLATRAPRLPIDSGSFIFCASAWALLTLLFAPFSVLRDVLRRGLYSRFPMVSSLLLGATDWLLFASVAILVQAPKVPSPELQVHLFYCGAVFTASTYELASRLSQRWRWLRHASLAVGIGGLLLSTKLHWDRHEYLRLALTCVFVTASSGWLQQRWSEGTALPRLRKSLASLRATALTLGAAFILSLSASFGFHSSHTARLALHARAAYLPSALYPLATYLDRDSDGALGWLGGYDCNPRNGAIHPGASERAGDGKDSNCANGDGKARPSFKPSIAFGSAKKRDVLLLSIDSWRWDHADQLARVRETLGPHVEFLRAVSPAPQTFYSMSALIRGRAVRQIKTSASRTLYRDRNPTLGDELTKQGYRAFTVMTNTRWGPNHGVNSGFEVVWPINRAARDLKNPAPIDPSYVDSEVALPVALATVASTPGPVACWVHLMDTHYPFHRGKRTGPANNEGYRLALSRVDRLLSAFISDFRAARKAEPIIILFGDHGEEFGEHGGINHGDTLYSDQVRVSFWLSAPGVSAQTIDAPVSLSSIPPTVLELLGVRPSVTMTEPSLAGPLAGDSQTEFPQVAVSEMRHPLRVLVAFTGPRYRLVTDPAHRIEELFDSDADPLEQHDIAQSQPDALRRMRELAQGWNETH